MLRATSKSTQRIIKNPFGIIETSGLMSWRFFLEKWLVKFFVKDVVVVVEFFVNSLSQSNDASLR